MSAKKATPKKAAKSKKPAARGRPKSKKPAVKKTAAKKPAARGRPKSKKPAVKKTAAKKPAARGRPRSKKPAVKKSAAKKPAARGRPRSKKPAVKKTAKSKKPAARGRPKSKKRVTKKSAVKKAVIAKFPTALKKAPSLRRPPNNQEIPLAYIADMEESFRSWRDELEDFARHLRSLDRQRLNGIGIKKLGFIGRALLLAAENSEFLPHYLTLQKFQEDNQYFLSLRSAFDVLRQVQEILWNVIVEAADILYTDALEYYAGVREAAKRRVDPSETLFNDLSVFFKRGARMADEPTEKQLKRDFDALEKGRKNGKLLIENVKPQMTGGMHKVVDETFKDTAHFKESEEGKIEE